MPPNQHRKASKKMVLQADETRRTKKQWRPRPLDISRPMPAALPPWRQADRMRPRSPHAGARKTDCLHRCHRHADPPGRCRHNCGSRTGAQAPGPRSRCASAWHGSLDRAPPAWPQPDHDTAPAVFRRPTGPTPERGQARKHCAGPMPATPLARTSGRVRPVSWNAMLLMDIPLQAHTHTHMDNPRSPQTWQERLRCPAGRGSSEIRREYLGLKTSSPRQAGPFGLDIKQLVCLDAGRPNLLLESEDRFSRWVRVACELWEAHATHNRLISSSSSSSVAFQHRGKAPATAPE